MSVPEREYERLLCGTEVGDHFPVYDVEPPCSRQQLQRRLSQQQRRARPPGKTLALLTHQAAPTNSLAMRATRSAAPGEPSLARTSASPFNMSCRRGPSFTRSSASASAMIAGMI